jgi:hypothetical protein
LDSVARWPKQELAAKIENAIHDVGDFSGEIARFCPYEDSLIERRE